MIFDDGFPLKKCLRENCEKSVRHTFEVFRTLPRTGRRRESLRFDVLFFKSKKNKTIFRNSHFRVKMQQQMQRERVTNERNSLGENSAESVSPVSSGAPATSRDLLNALAEQKLPTLLQQKETPKTPRRSKSFLPVEFKIKSLS